MARRNDSRPITWSAACAVVENASRNGSMAASLIGLFVGSLI